MRFVRLRIAGFKSFVDPVEAPIEPGVTGVVGPNGCGKSNFLEALRWVMGAASAKAMRAGGMDDVIFAGNVDRPARNHAEVTLTIESTGAEDDASGLFGEGGVIEVSRRITRGGGSTYRINGRETRARDVQILFADASSGANSPALVRQGQINELIAAKPENRRRVLEEAAGVAGLRTRRHEAELRLKAAEDNLSRLEDAAGDSERRLEALRRQAREAARYRKLSGEIKALDIRSASLRWRDAEAVHQAACAELAETDAAVAAAERAERMAAAKAVTASEALTPAREEEAVAQAIAGRLGRDRDALDQKIQALQAEAEHLSARVGELDADLVRERARLEDAGREAERLAESLSEAGEDDDASALADLADADTARQAAEDARRAADAALETAAAALASSRAEREAAARTLAGAETRLARLDEALAGLAGEDDADETQKARERADALAAALGEAEDAAEAAETTRRSLEEARETADAARAAARAASSDAQTALGAIDAEMAGLAAISASSATQAASPAFAAMTLAEGLEQAVAAALGPDLLAGLDEGAPVRWTDDGVEGPPLPADATPLSELVDAPRALAPRLAQIGLVADDAAGERLARSLACGQCLVTREGRLWRWDGLRALADAPNPEASRLEQRTRLDALSAQRETAAAAAHEAELAYAAASAEAERLAQSVGPARARERAAQDEVKRLTRDGLEAARRRDGLEAKTAARAETQTRLAKERAEADAALAGAREALETLGPSATDEAAVERLRQEAETRRGAEAEARARRDALSNGLDERRAQRKRLAAEAAQWRERRTHAAEHVAALDAKRTAAIETLDEVKDAPTALRERLETLRDELDAAEARRRAASDAAARAHQAAKEADAAHREGERAMSAARETRAGAAARAQAAEQRRAEIAEQIQDAFGAPADALTEDPDLAALDAAAVEKRLKDAHRARDRLGAVNLAAEDDVAGMESEMQSLQVQRADLVAAVAKLRAAIGKLNAEGREKLTAAFDIVDGHFQRLFAALFGGGEAKLALIDAEDPLEAGLDIHVSPPGKKLGSLSLMSGGEQALTATALIFAVFLSNPAPLCALDEVDAPLDDANVDRFCRLLAEMRRLTDTRFIVITHNAVTMARMDRLYGVTMAERGVSQLVSVDLDQAERLIAAE